MSYHHLSVSGNQIELPTGKVVCVGRNYADHIQELNNSVPDEPLLFIKPNTALADMNTSLLIPPGNCHNELEVALLIAKPLQVGTSYSTEEVISSLWGVGLALDLTLRDKQSELKQKGHPWERAKAFDNSCPLSGFVPCDEVSELQNIAFELLVNGDIRQSGNTRLMLNNCIALIREILTCFTLLPGDVVLTGTPKGVGPLHSGDKLSARMRNNGSKIALIDVSTTVV